MYHLHVRWFSYTREGTAVRRLDYITRTGPYARRPDKLRMVVSGRMPAWVASRDAREFWAAADSLFNRVNARIGYSIEVALPRDLTSDQQNALALDFASAVSTISVGEDVPDRGLPFTLALHEGYGRNPHMHGMFCSSVEDGIDREPQAWFRRASAKNPAAGGARRSRFVGRKRWLLLIRELWATFANRALRAAGLEPSLDHRSYTERGIARVAENHRGPDRGSIKPRPSPNWAIDPRQIEQIERALRAASSVKRKSEEDEATRKARVEADEANRVKERHDRARPFPIEEATVPAVTERKDSGASHLGERLEQAELRRTEQQETKQPEIPKRRLRQPR